MTGTTIRHLAFAVFARSSPHMELTGCRPTSANLTRWNRPSPAVWFEGHPQAFTRLECSWHAIVEDHGPSACHNRRVCGRGLHRRETTMNDRTAVFVRSFPVGKHAVTMTVIRRRFLAGRIICRWSPPKPPRLTKEEKHQYRSGRAAAVADAYGSIRGLGLIVER
jgi:hypothetical protein